MNEPAPQIDPALAAVLADLMPADPAEQFHWVAKLHRVVASDKMRERFQAATGNYYEIPAVAPLDPTAFTEERRATASYIRCYAKWFNRVIWDRREVEPAEGRWEQT